jgi:hypothetical protein
VDVARVGAAQGSGADAGGHALQSGATPLFMAAQFGQGAVVRTLVEAGADITAKSNVSKRRVEGGGHGGRRVQRFRGKVMDSLVEPHTPVRTTVFWRRQTMACERPAQQWVDVEGLRLHKMRFAGCWVCRWVRGVALKDVRDIPK